QWYQSKFPEATESFRKAEQQFTRIGDKKRLGILYYIMSVAEWQSGYYEHSFQHAVSSKELLHQKDLSNLEHVYKAVGDYESALNLYHQDVKGSSIWMAEIYMDLHQYDSAWYYYTIFRANIRNADQTELSKFYSGAGELYSLSNQFDSAFSYIARALQWQRKV